jgi:hypothetical protein
VAKKWRNPQEDCKESGPESRIASVKLVDMESTMERIEIGRERLNCDYCGFGSLDDQR